MALFEYGSQGVNLTCCKLLELHRGQGPACSPRETSVGREATTRPVQTSHFAGSLGPAANYVELTSIHIDNRNGAHIDH